MVDNFEQLKKLMDFSDEDKFYYLQILARSKDGHNKATKVVKNYYIQNEEYFDSHRQQIIDICEFFTARAYLRLNRRSYRDVAFENLKQISNTLANGQYKFASRSFSKACGRKNSEPKDSKVWIVDVDYPFEGATLTETVNEIVGSISVLQSQIRDRDYKVLDVVPTVSGYHILTNPFNQMDFRGRFGDEVDIHTDNPTILWANV